MGYPVVAKKETTQNEHPRIYRQFSKKRGRGYMAVLLPCTANPLWYTNNVAV